jgi:hypothetical protein
VTIPKDASAKINADTEKSKKSIKSGYLTKEFMVALDEAEPANWKTLKEPQPTVEKTCSAKPTAAYEFNGKIFMNYDEYLPLPIGAICTFS